MIDQASEIILSVPYKKVAFKNCLHQFLNFNSIKDGIYKYE